MGQRLPQEHEHQGEDQHGQHIGGGEQVHAEGQGGHGRGEQSGVKHDARRAVGPEEDFFIVFLADAVEDVDDHHQQQHKYAQTDGQNQQQQDIAHHAQARKGSLLHDFKTGENVLKAEHRPVDAAEQRAGQAAAGDDAAQPHALPPGQYKANEGQTEPLPQIAEHDAEEQAVGQGHEQGGVLLVVGGQAIHLQEGLEHPAQEGVLQLGGGLGVAHVVGGIGHAGQVGEPGERFLDLRHRRRRHPAGEVKGALAAAGVLAQPAALAVVAQVGVAG